MCSYLMLVKARFWGINSSQSEKWRAFQSSCHPSLQRMYYWIYVKTIYYNLEKDVMLIKFWYSASKNAKKIIWNDLTVKYLSFQILKWHNFQNFPVLIDSTANNMFLFIFTPEAQISMDACRIFAYSWIILPHQREFILFNW